MPSREVENESAAAYGKRPISDDIDLNAQRGGGS
jgi:hypothetical protein